MNVTLWLEITIAGAVYLLAAVFWVLVSLSPSDVQLSSWSSHLEQYLPYFAVGFAAASYVVGILAHRVIQLTPRKLINFFLAFLSTKPETYVTWDRENMVRIWQYGSERLHRELDFQYGLAALIRSLIFSVPLLGAGIATWLHSSNREGTWQAVVLAAVVWLSCALALGRQWQNYFHTEMAATKVLKSVEVEATQESEAEDKGDGSRSRV
jgi:hypothetical protein